MALRQASVSPSDVDLVEVDDTFAYKQLQHMDALGFDRSRLGTNRVNPSGGARTDVRKEKWCEGHCYQGSSPLSGWS